MFLFLNIRIETPPEIIEMRKTIKPFFFISAICGFVLVIFATNCQTKIKSGTDEDFRKQQEQAIITSVRQATIEKADQYLDKKPVTVTDAVCPRSAGEIHDFYSEGDYWWPDPENPDGPYIRKDGQSNPENFSDHRHAMVRLSEITATLTSAWILTKKKKYAEKALDHLNAWFVDTTTLMNPHMLYAQAISGRFTGRGIGLIDAYHLVEVTQSVRVLEKTNAIPLQQLAEIKAWFSDFLSWK